MELKPIVYISPCTLVGIDHGLMFCVPQITSLRPQVTDFRVIPISNVEK
jgi:hypothetical protein